MPWIKTNAVPMLGLAITLLGIVIGAYIVLSNTNVLVVNKVEGLQQCSLVQGDRIRVLELRVNTLEARQEEAARYWASFNSTISRNSDVLNSVDSSLKVMAEKFSSHDKRITTLEKKP